MKRITVVLAALFGVYAASVCSATAAVMNDYCIKPPFVSQTVPPLVMFETGRDHKFYYQAYNDAIDLDDDDQIDSKYKHSIQYYGYFDPFKCYTHSGGATGGSGTSDQFTPVSTTNDKFCGSGQWSGNVLNWLTMSRMDVLRRVLYGGARKTDSGTATSLLRSFIPQDAHSWGKELTGRLCYDNGAGVYSYTCSTSSDCKSGDTCVDKSNNLIGINAADAPSACASGVTAPTYSTADKILVARYQSKDQANNVRTGICGDYTYTYDSTTNQSTERDAIYLSYFNWDTTSDGPLNDSLNLLDYYFISDFDFKDASTAKLDADPLKDHVDNFNFFVAAEFNVASNDRGDWQFLLDGDDGVELLVDGVVKSIYPGCHPACFQAASSTTYPPKDPASFVCTGGGTPPTVATVNLSSGIHRLLVRHRDNTGQDGIRLWFRKTTSNATSWSVFGTTALGSGNLKAPNITATNDCSIKSAGFIGNGTPLVGTAKQHVFCNTTLSNNGQPLLRLSKNSPNRMWEWAARERPVCGANFKVSGSDVAANPIDYSVQVEVCKTGLLEDNCKGYPIGSSTPTSYKPVGLLQKYGDGDNTKVCSKTMSKTCNTDSGCDLATEGLCINKTGMYFGMASTSYSKNMSGGVIRKNFGSMLDEVNSNQGYVETAESISGNIIHTFDKMSVVDFDYTGSNTPSYLANCPFSAGAYGVFTEGTQCRMWGNPIAEMMYESLRYLAGKGTPTAAFDYTTSSDAGLNLSHPNWGKFGTGSATYKPYDIFPSCARPFLLVLSDINTSYDDDQLPGTSFGSYTEDAALPKLNINVTTLANTISAAEGVDGNQFFIGETTSLTDYVCSAKTVAKLSLIRGICPEEPTKRGSFYAAAVAYYGKNGFRLNTGLPEVNTFVIALSSPIANLKIKAGSSYITMVPVGKSVHGGWTSNIHCLDRCSSSYIDKNADGTVNKGLVLSGCTAGAIDPATEAGGAYCPSNQIVNTFVKDIRYDASNNVIYAKFTINYEDVEMGSDHEMDAMVDYEICTTASVGLSGTSCTATLTADQIEVKLNSTYAAGGVDQTMGFVVSGTTSDGLYLPVRDTDSSTLTNGYTTSGGNVIKLPTQWQKTFSTNSSAVAANFLKSPLWYAAKWGGFTDKNGNNIPDQKSEWAANCTETDITKCDPDNYFLVVNPLKLEQQLDKALNDIMRRVASGTAASILNNSEGSGANLLQAVFYPTKSFDDNTEISWIGEMQNLWYFLDPALQKTSIREDSNQNNVLNLKSDLVAQFYFDPSDNKTRVKRFADNNGDGAADDPSTPVDTVNPEDVKSLWKAGRMLWERNISSDPRTIYTGYNSTIGTTPQKFSNSAADSFSTTPEVWDALQIPAGTDVERTALATKLISYVHGSDQVNDATPCLNTDCKYRPRKVTLNDCNTGIYAGRVPDNNCTREWKLGDIISSTPKLISNVALNQYNLAPPRGYNDSSYLNFTLTGTYRNRGMVMVGGNDGMLHAFKLGVLKELNGKFDKAQMNNSTGTRADAGDKLGREEWAYIPKHTLPYLKYLTDTNYSHLYYVDRTPTVFDASIGKPAGCGTDYSGCSKVTDGSTWRTIVIAGMGIGGASRNTGSACSTTTDCVKNPLAENGYSSYFALDVTDPANPKTLWEFAGDPGGMGTLGYSTTGPAIVRIAKKDASGTPDHTKNGKWFAVFASGPTGPIDTTGHQFKGQSDQNLKIFIVDIGTGALVSTIDTGVTNAFAGSLASSWVDTDRSNSTSPGFYSDDVVYIGYVQKDTTVTPNTWTKGGVLRLMTRESDEPASVTPAKQWVVRPLISGTGPVTTSVTKLQDRANNTMWVYWGTGRFYFKADDPSTGTKQTLYGIKDPCYSTANRKMMLPIAGGTLNDYDQYCTDAATTTTAISCSGLFSGLCDQSGVAGAPVATLPASIGGWFVNLDAANSTYLAERVVTDSVASGAGAVFFTTFKPSADICKFGGDTFIWALNYASGGPPPDKAMEGKALIQVSTGAFKELSLKKAFDWQHPEVPPLVPPTAAEIQRYDQRRTMQPIPGVPPTAQGLSLITNPPAVKKFLHIREK